MQSNFLIANWCCFGWFFITNFFICSEWVVVPFLHAYILTCLSRVISLTFWSKCLLEQQYVSTLLILLFDYFFPLKTIKDLWRAFETDQIFYLCWATYANTGSKFAVLAQYKEKKDPWLKFFLFFCNGTGIWTGCEYGPPHILVSQAFYWLVVWPNLSLVRWRAWQCVSYCECVAISES
jgi:hypothetical protein